MSLYKDKNNTIHDDDNGRALLLPSWPKNLTPITQAEADAIRKAPQPLVIPASVTMRQARLALLSAGLINNVTTAINALASPQKEAATIEWEYSQEVHRDKPFVSVLAVALGLTDAQLDDLFLTASTL